MSEDSALDPLTAADISLIGPFTRRIWREHYAGIISAEQIEYMLRNKYDEADLRPYIGAGERTDDRTFDLLRIAGALAGFLRCKRIAPDTVKIEEIYLDAAWRGRGFGARMLEHAHTRARAWGCARLMLHVNKRNAIAIRAYERRGFVIHRAFAADIGGGFVMDDYEMQMAL